MFKQTVTSCCSAGSLLKGTKVCSLVSKVIVKTWSFLINHSCCCLLQTSSCLLFFIVKKTKTSKQSSYKSDHCNWFRSTSSSVDLLIFYILISKHFFFFFTHLVDQTEHSWNIYHQITTVMQELTRKSVLVWKTHPGIS